MRRLSFALLGTLHYWLQKGEKACAGLNRLSVSFFGGFLFTLTLGFGSIGLGLTLFPAPAVANSFDGNEQAYSSNKIQACATYRRRNGSWSKHYKVWGELSTGADLKSQFHDENYRDADLYFLITWKNGGHNSLYLGSSETSFNPPLVTQDQKGKLWHLSLNVSDCDATSLAAIESLAAQTLDSPEFSSQPQFATVQKIKGCATYQRKDGSWSKHYKVRGELLSGKDVVSRLQNFPTANSKSFKQDHTDYSYEPYSKYFFIHWKNGGFSALHVGSGIPADRSSLIRDQKGKVWTLTSGWDECSNGFFESLW